MNRYLYPTFKHPPIAFPLVVGSRVKYKFHPNAEGRDLRGTIVYISASEHRVANVQWDSPLGKPYVLPEYLDGLEHE
jgi:hypothetical protein